MKTKYRNLVIFLIKKITPLSLLATENLQNQFFFEFFD
jgi:hypothetical protein